MPHRANRKFKDIRLSSVEARPAWNLEPDYHERESFRRAILAIVRARATRFDPNIAQCPGCDDPIWEASVPEKGIFRGCHCLTFCYLESEPFSLELWSTLINLNDQRLAENLRRTAIRN